MNYKLYATVKGLKNIKNSCRCATKHTLNSRMSVVHWRTNEDLCNTDVISPREDEQIRKWPNIACKDLDFWYLTLKTCLVLG